MWTKKELQEDNKILRDIVESNKTTANHYATATQLRTVKKWNSFFIGCGIAACLLVILHYCAPEPTPARNASPPREVEVERLAIPILR